MAVTNEERSELLWSLVSWGAAIVAAVVIGYLVGNLTDGRAAAGIVFGGVSFIVVAWVLSSVLGPPPRMEDTLQPAGHAGHGHGHAAHPAPLAHAADVEAALASERTLLAEAVAAVSPTLAPAPPSEAPAAAISERVREAARAAGEAARAAVGEAPRAFAGEAVRPTPLESPRGGHPDDLKRIKGIGPRLEEMLHGLGFYHFDQVAAWNAAELAWVDSHLEGFSGRATRDDWIGQAKLLAGGEETDFSRRVDRGELY